MVLDSGGPGSTEVVFCDFCMCVFFYVCLLVSLYFCRGPMCTFVYMHVE